jgi:hypothetical protein
LLARVWSVAAEPWAGQEAEWEAELAALEATGAYEVPTEAELAGVAPDPLAGPPEGEWAWLADLPGPLLEEYLEATAEPVRPEPLPAGLWSRAAGDGSGFAGGGAGDRLVPGPVLAGLVAGARADGLGKLTDDETSDAVKLSSCVGEFRGGSWECRFFVVGLPGGQAVVEAAEEAAEEVALGGGVPVAVCFAAVVVGAGAG